MLLARRRFIHHERTGEQTDSRHHILNRLRKSYFVFRLKWDSIRARERREP